MKILITCVRSADDVTLSDEATSDSYSDAETRFCSQCSCVCQKHSHTKAHSCRERERQGL